MAKWVSPEDQKKPVALTDLTNFQKDEASVLPADTSLVQGSPIVSLGANVSQNPIISDNPLHQFGGMSWEDINALRSASSPSTVTSIDKDNNIVTSRPGWAHKGGESPYDAALKTVAPMADATIGAESRSETAAANQSAVNDRFQERLANTIGHQKDMFELASERLQLQQEKLNNKTSDKKDEELYKRTEQAQKLTKDYPSEIDWSHPAMQKALSEGHHPIDIVNYLKNMAHPMLIGK